MPEARKKVHGVGIPLKRVSAVDEVEPFAGVTLEICRWLPPDNFPGTAFEECLGGAIEAQAGVTDVEDPATGQVLGNLGTENGPVRIVLVARL